jgi:multidrug resistance efflux pump
MTSPISEHELANARELARLGAELAAASARMTEAAERLEEQQGVLAGQMSQLQREVQHYKGIVGGVAFVFSGMFAVLVAFKGWLFGDR